MRIIAYYKIDSEFNLTAEIRFYLVLEWERIVGRGIGGNLFVQIQTGDWWVGQIIFFKLII